MNNIVRAALIVAAVLRPEPAQAAMILSPYGPKPCYFTCPYLYGPQSPAPRFPVPVTPGLNAPLLPWVPPLPYILPPAYVLPPMPGYLPPPPVAVPLPPVAPPPPAEYPIK